MKYLVLCFGILTLTAHSAEWSEGRWGLNHNVKGASKTGAIEITDCKAGVCSIELAVANNNKAAHTCDAFGKLAVASGKVTADNACELTLSKAGDQLTITSTVEKCSKDNCAADVSFDGKFQLSKK